MRIQTFANRGVDADSAPASVRGGLERFHTKARLEAILQRERARADRTGRQLSFVIFRISQSGPHVRALYRLARTAIQRARITDDIGGYDSDSIAAVLPDTSEPGAWTFAHDVLTALGQRVPSVGVSVYSYPLDRQRQPSTSRRQGSPEYGPDQRPAVSARSSHRAKASPRALSPWNANIKSSGMGSETWPQSLEHLLLRPIPHWKRAIDIVGAGTALILALPLLLVVALAAKLSSPGPVLFVQLRAGRGGRPFRMYKFRTMHVNAEHRKAELSSLSEQDGPAFKMRDDPRVTRIGRILRQTSVDELPQLWNVLKGEMSLVGPRPLPCDEAEACHPWHQRRHDVLPGLTCIWQIRGRSRVSFEEWMRMDRAYIRSLGLLRDLLILLQTVPAVLVRRGAC